MMEQPIVVTAEEARRLSLSAQNSIVTPPLGGPSRRGVWMTVLVLAMCASLIGGLVAYAYVKQVGPFSVTQYTESNLLSSILKKSSEITTASYTFTAALSMVQRDQDAVPFTIDAPSDEKLAQYDRDVRRISDVESLVSTLSYGYGEQKFYDYKTKKYVSKPGKPYPPTLNALEQASYQTSSRKDPVTGPTYAYEVTEGGKNFAITTTLETQDAIYAIRDSYQYVATTTIISGNKVTFTKGSQYMRIPSTLPEPLLVSLSDSLRSIPPDVSGSVSMGATADLSTVGLPDWRINATAVGDMGDLSYKVDVEARKKDDSYYVRINNIPSIIPYLGSYKGMWIEINSKTSSSTENEPPFYNYNPFSDLTSTIADAEKNYKSERAEIAEELRALVALADEVRLIGFKESPVRETVGGRDLYRYRLTINKDAIVAFYTKVLEDPAKYKKIRIVKDDGLLDYLKSSQFEKVFNYVTANTHITLWTDMAGFPAKVEYRIRIIPPETAVQLKEKQAEAVLSLDLSDINEPVQIEKPEPTKSIQQVIDEIDGNTGSTLVTARQKVKEAEITSNISSIRVQAELYYDAGGGGSYGTQPWVTGAASKCNVGMFKDPSVTKALTAADTANADAGGVACYANGKNYLVGAVLSAKEWWCADSTGASRKEFSSLPAVLPTGGKCP